MVGNFLGRCSGSGILRAVGEMHFKIHIIFKHIVGNSLMVKDQDRNKSRMIF
jgi:hypothetical protein